MTGALFRARLRAWGGPPEPGAGVLASYALSTDGSMPYPVYFPSDGRGTHVARPYRTVLPDGTRFEHPLAALFTPATPNELGLHAALHIVELEVNGGAGGGEGHFVATRTRVLDGTDAIPMRTVEVLGAIQARIDDALRRAARAIAAVRRHGTVVTDASTVRATWRPADRTLETTFTLELASERRGTDIHRRSDPCPPCPCDDAGRCAPCVRCLPDTHAYVELDVRVLRMGLVHVVEADGRIRSEAVFAPRIERSTATADVSVTPADP